MLEIFMLLIGGGALAFVLYLFVRDQVRWYHANRPNRYVRSNWPRKGAVAPKGFFADSTQRGGTECAGKGG